MLSRLRLFRERGWTAVDAGAYAEIWQRYGGSVATHPQVVARLSELAGIPVRYLGWYEGDQPLAAIPTWGRHLALSKEVLKRRGKRALFDLGNAEVILPVAPQAHIVLRHRARYLSDLHRNRILNLRGQPEALAMCRAPGDLSKKFRYNQRRELRLLEEAGGRLRPLAELAPDEQARIYGELFERRWDFEVPGKARLAEVFGLLREFMCGSVVWFGDKPVAIQILYRVESPAWISVEYVNGGVAPESNGFSPGSVLTFVNTQEAWADAEARGKTLRYSFGRADREYKDRWCRRVPVYQV